MFSAPATTCRFVWFVRVRMLAGKLGRGPRSATAAAFRFCLQRLLLAGLSARLFLRCGLGQSARSPFSNIPPGYSGWLRHRVSPACGGRSRSRPGERLLFGRKAARELPMPNEKAPAWVLLALVSGDYLLSRTVSSQVPSACESLTSVFGMGTGGSSQLSPPDW